MNIYFYKDSTQDGFFLVRDCEGITRSLHLEESRNEINELHFATNQQRASDWLSLISQISKEFGEKVVDPDVDFSKIAIVRSQI